MGLAGAAAGACVDVAAGGCVGADADPCANTATGTAEKVANRKESLLIMGNAPCNDVTSFPGAESHPGCEFD